MSDETANQNDAAAGAPSPAPVWLQASLDDAKQVDIEAPLAGSNEADCHALSDIYGKAANDLKVQKTNTANSVLIFVLLTNMNYFLNETCLTFTKPHLYLQFCNF